MFCRKCGKGEQVPDSYCRSCGEVLKVWTGAFAEEMQKEVEEYFGVSLPGLMDPEKAD